MRLTLPAKFRKSFHLAKSTKEKGATETPLMRQYNQIKAKHPKAMLLFRVGDFYETFGEKKKFKGKMHIFFLFKYRSWTCRGVFG